MRLSYQYSVTLGKMLDESQITGEFLVPYLRNQDVQWGRVNLDNLPMMDIRPEEYARCSARRGDVLVCEGGEIGRSAVWESDAPIFYQKAIIRLRPIDASKNLGRYMFYLMRASTACHAFDNATGKSTIAHLPAEKLISHKFPFPPLSEQRAIAARLDAECGKIDALKAKIEKEIAALEEYRKSLITKCVTKGLHPRRLVPSGVDWIGDVPEGWKVMRLKYLVSKIGSGKTPTGGANCYPDEGIIFLRSQNVYDDGLHLEDVEHISEVTDSEMSSTRVRKNDVLLNITGGSIGRCCVYDLDLSANVNQHVCIVRPTEELTAFYLHYYLNGYAEHIVNDNQQGGNRESLNFEQIGNLELLFPPLSEQREIADYLDKKCEAIDAVVAKRRKQLEELAEYRKSVVYSYVTGKKEVAA